LAFGPELVWMWSEYLSRLAGRRVQRVEGAGSVVFLSLSGGSVLLLSWGAQNCGAAVVSDEVRKSLLSSAAQTPAITSALRSHLAGAELESVGQLRRDRLLRFSFKKTVGAGFVNVRNVTLEVMERYSNIVLTDENNSIIETAKHVYPADNAYRSVLPGQDYVLPPEFPGLALEEWLKAPSDDTLHGICGFGRQFIKAAENYEPAALAAYLGRFYKSGRSGAMTAQRLGKYVTVFPELLEGASAAAGGVEGTCADIVVSPLLNRGADSIRKKIVAYLKKELVRRERQTADINRLLYEDEPEVYKKRGELIVANMWKIRRGEPQVTLSMWDENGAERTETVPLDPAVSAAQNAEKYFAKYKKIMAARERAARVLKKVTQETEELQEELSMAMCLDDAESLLLLENELGLAKPLPVRKKKDEHPAPPHRRFDLGFALAWAGLSAKGNHYVTFRLAVADDVWFHAQGGPGPHVILRYNDAPSDEQREQAVKFCASLAAHYSKGRDNMSQRVDYTLRKHVAPIRGGEAHVTYKEFSSVTAEVGFWERYLSETESAQAAGEPGNS